MQVKSVSITVSSVLFSLLLSSFVYAQRNQPEVGSIPDANLAAAVREIIGDSITTHTLLDITDLTVEERGIENLTGLETCPQPQETAPSKECDIRYFLLIGVDTTD